MVVLDGVTVEGVRTSLDDLHPGPQVDDGSKAEPCEGVDVVVGDGLEAVGAREAPPSDGAAVAGDVAAEIPEVTPWRASILTVNALPSGGPPDRPLLRGSCK